MEGRVAGKDFPNVTVPIGALGYSRVLVEVHVSAAGITTTGTGELRMIFVELEPRKTLLRGPSRLEPTTSTSPSSQGASRVRPPSCDR